MPHKSMRNYSIFFSAICIGIGPYAGSFCKQSNVELYPVKIFLDQVEIGRYLPTYLDGIMITQNNI